MSVFKARGGYVAKFQHEGKQHWTPGGPWPTKRQATEAQRRHRDRLEARRTEETCASFAERWLEEWPRAATSTKRNYAEAAKRFAEHFGPTPLGDVERLSARTWALSVPRYVHRTIRTMYSDAANVGLVDSNPFSNLRLPTTERTEQIRAPSLEEYRQALEACTVLGGYGREFRVMIQFAAWTGVRAGELQALRWEDVGQEVITIRHARRRDGSEGPPKNGRSRVISFLPPARVLDALPRRPDPYVFHSPRGKVLDNGSHFYAWRELRATAGLRHVRWHDWRHFCATQLLELRLDHFAVSIQLGHTDGGALVMERYGHPSEDAARERLLGAFSFDGAETGSRTGSRDSRKAHGQAE
jgi:integrase